LPQSAVAEAGPRTNDDGTADQSAGEHGHAICRAGGGITSYEPQQPLQVQQGTVGGAGIPPLLRLLHLLQLLARARAIVIMQLGGDERLGHHDAQSSSPLTACAPSKSWRARAASRRSGSSWTTSGGLRRTSERSLAPRSTPLRWWRCWRAASAIASKRPVCTNFVIPLCFLRVVYCEEIPRAKRGS
jgi:hypothetical protein